MDEMTLWQTTLCASEPKCTRKTEPRTKRNTWFYRLPGQAVVFRNQKPTQRKGLWGFTGKYRISLVLAGIVSVLPAWFITFPGRNRVPERKGQAGRKRVCRREEGLTAKRSFVDAFVLPFCFSFNCLLLKGSRVTAGFAAVPPGRAAQGGTTGGARLSSGDV